MRRWVGLGVLVVAVCASLTLCGGSVSAVVGGVVADRTWTVAVPASVRGKRWSRTVVVQRWDNVELSGWCSDVPDGAEVIERELRGTAVAKIPRRSPPWRRHPRSPRRAWCRYRVDTWVAESWRRRDGSGDEARTWPQSPAVDACPEPSIGCRRSLRVEAFGLALAPEGAEPVECAVTEATWNRIEIGDRVEVPYSAVLGRPRCDEMR